MCFITDTQRPEFHNYHIAYKLLLHYRETNRYVRPYRQDCPVHPKPNTKDVCGYFKNDLGLYGSSFIYCNSGAYLNTYATGDGLYLFTTLSALLDTFWFRDIWQFKKDRKGLPVASVWKVKPFPLGFVKSICRTQLCVKEYTWLEEIDTEELKVEITSYQNKKDLVLWPS